VQIPPCAVASCGEGPLEEPFDEACRSIAYRAAPPILGRWFLSKLKDEGLLAAPDESVLVCAGVPQSTCVVLSGAVDRAMVSCYSSNRLMQAEAFEEQLLGLGSGLGLGLGLGLANPIPNPNPPGACRRRRSRSRC
jgi:hypothetical protein